MWRGLLGGAGLRNIPSTVRNHPDAELCQEILNLINVYQLSFDDLRAHVGPIAPGFGQPGGGTQHLFPLSTDMMEGARVDQGGPSVTLTREEILTAIRSEGLSGYRNATILER